MVTLDTLEGMINGSISYHYAATADVLYLRRAGTLDAATLGEETDDGLIELRAETSGELALWTTHNLTVTHEKSPWANCAQGLRRYSSPILPARPLN